MFLFRLTEAISLLTKEIRRLIKVTQLRRPGLVFGRMIREGVDGMSKFVLDLPEPSAADVASGGSRELVFAINGGDPITQPLGGAVRVSDQFDATEGDVVTGTLVDIDDAVPPNRSEPRTFEIQLRDNQAPGQPGEVTGRMVEE